MKRQIIKEILNGCNLKEVMLKNTAPIPSWIVKDCEGDTNKISETLRLDGCIDPVVIMSAEKFYNIGIEPKDKKPTWFEYGQE